MVASDHSGHLKTYVYVDGFNLYYRALKRTPYKWLNLEALFKAMLPNNDVEHIKYFTARVRPRPDNPAVHLRQDTYLRALRSLSCVQVHYGTFMERPVWLPLKSSAGEGIQRVEVLRSEEKGSDVNLASHLLLDGFRNAYDVAIVVSNDSDLATPVAVARRELGKRIGILSPSRRPTRMLVDEATFWRPILPKHLQRAQFPESFKDADGTIHKPAAWE